MTDDTASEQAIPRETSPATPLPRTRQKSNRILGMTIPQLAVIAVLGLCLICTLVVGFAVVMGFIPNISF